MAKAAPLTSIAIAWRAPGKAGAAPRYYVNGKTVGSGSRGFDAVLALVRAHPAAAVTLKPGETPLGGQDLAATTPFAGRFAELVEAAGGRRLAWDLM